nr:HIT domain protein [uncultured bacterium]
MSKFVDPANTKHRPEGTYSKAIDKIIKDGVCPFCPEHLAAYHPHPVIREGEHWLYTKNAYPYKGAIHHFLVIHKSHIEDFAEITPAAWLELQELINVIATTHAIKGGALVCRFGETKYNGASVAHLHAQIIVGPGTEGSEPVLMRVG